MLRRKIEEKLELWYKSNTALFINGARQVGKTYILDDFSKKHFDNYIYINFIEKANDIPQFIKNQDVEGFLFNLSTIIDKPMIKGKTVIFFDEIQHIYTYMQDHGIPYTDFDLITLMKFLVQEGSYRYMLSGSLLGTTLDNVVSWPTGYMTSYTMYPLDFEEFLWANNIQNDVIEHVKTCFYEKKEVDAYVHDKFMDLFHKYLIIGGMPEAVNVYINTNDYNLVSLAHQNIEMYNRRDILKYAPQNNRLYISQIYELICEELNKKNKRFGLTQLKNKNNHSIIDNSFLWLINAGIVIPAYCVHEPISPLRASMQRRQLKLFHEDTGLLIYSYMDKEIVGKLLNEVHDINYGAIYENFFATNLRSHGYEYMYYYNNKKNGEVDFIIEYKGEIIPVEIKSGKDYSRHLALNNLLKINNYNIKQSFIFYNDNTKIKDNKLYFPIYMAAFIE